MDEQHRYLATQQLVFPISRDPSWLSLSIFSQTMFLLPKCYQCDSSQHLSTLGVLFKTISLFRMENKLLVCNP